MNTLSPTRSAAGRRFLGGLLLWLALLPGWLGCSRSPSQQAAQAGGNLPAVSPRETVARLIEARRTGAYQAMTPLIVPARAADVLTTLVAVDDFLSANQQLCDLVRDKVGLGLAQTIDQSFRAYYLDIFSKYVELLDEQIAGDDATVSFTVDGHLPALHAHLRIVAGSWRYDPGPGDYMQLADAFGRMARGLRQVVAEIESGRLSAAQLRDDPELLVREVDIRLRPGVKLLPAPPNAGADGSGP